MNEISPNLVPRASVSDQSGTATTLGRALADGLELPRALRLTAACSDDAAIAERLARAARHAQQGAETPAVLEQAGFSAAFTGLLTELLDQTRDEGRATTTGSRALAELAAVSAAARPYIASLTAALVYPLIVLAAVVCGSALLTFGVLPELATFRAELGWSSGAAPAELLNLLHTVGLPATALVAIVLLLIISRARPRLRARLIPPLVQATRGALCRALGALVEAGLAPTRALALAAASCPDRPLRRALERAGQNVAQGGSLDEQLIAHQVVDSAWAGPLSLALRRDTLASTLTAMGRALTLEAELRFAPFRTLIVTALLATAGALVLLCALAALGGLF
jgi:type II secretory pathway component PulF